MMNKKVWLICFCCLLSVGLRAGDTDSMYRAAKAMPDDSSRLRLYNKVAFAYIFNDTIKARAVLNEGLQLAERTNRLFSRAELTNTLGIYMDVNGHADSADYYFHQALDWSKEQGYADIEAMCLNNLGMFQWNKGHQEKALDYFFRALKMNEQLKDHQGIASALNNLGLIYQEMFMNDKALAYHKRALQIREQYGQAYDQISSLNNIGINLVELNQIRQAIGYYQKGLKLAQDIQNQLEIYKLYNNLANAYQLNNQYQEAISSYQEALSLTERYTLGLQYRLNPLNNLVVLYNLKRAPKTALQFAREGMQLIQQHPEWSDRVPELYLNTAECYYLLQLPDSARMYRDQYIAQQDKRYSEGTAQAIASLEVEYDTQKKENELLAQRAKLAEKTLLVQRKNQFIAAVVVAALLICGGILLLYQRQRNKNRRIRQENEYKIALHAVEHQEKMQEQKLAISRDLHDNVGARLSFIISALDTLKILMQRKDQSGLPKLDQLSLFTRTTIWELRDTVWAMNKQAIGIADMESRIRNYLERFDEEQPDTQIVFDSTAGLEQVDFDAQTGMHLYRIVQEAIHNAIRHAHARHIHVRFALNRTQCTLIVQDDGRGIDPDRENSGNGLRNMHHRAGILKGQLLIDSSPQGTTITLQFPMPQNGGNAAAEL